MILRLQTLPLNLLIVYISSLYTYTYLPKTSTYSTVQYSTILNQAAVLFSITHLLFSSQPTHLLFSSQPTNRPLPPSKSFPERKPKAGKVGTPALNHFLFFNDQTSLPTGGCEEFSFD